MRPLMWLWGGVSEGVAIKIFRVQDEVEIFLSAFVVAATV